MRFVKTEPESDRVMVVNKISDRVTALYRISYAEAMWFYESKHHKDPVLSAHLVDTIREHI